MNLYRLIYVSRVTRTEVSGGTSSDMLARIARTAARHNGEHAITGVLVHGEGRFLQQLEGARDALETLYERIKADPRHIDVVLATIERAPVRSYSDWSMAVVDDETRDLNLVHRAITRSRRSFEDVRTLIELLLPTASELVGGRIPLVQAA